MWIRLSFSLGVLCALCGDSVAAEPGKTVAAAEAERIAVINKVKPVVVAVCMYGGEGAGSGVLIDPEGNIVGYTSGEGNYEVLDKVIAKLIKDHAAKKTLTMAGEGPGMDGKMTKYRSVTEFTDENTLTMTMQMGEGKDNSFVVIYKRRK